MQKPTSFMEIFRLLGGGATDEELSEELAELAQRVLQTSKAGQISLTIKVVPASDTTVELIDKITVRKPEFKREPHEFQVRGGGTLVDAGVQSTIAMRVVGERRVLTKDGVVDASTGEISE